MNKKNIKLIAIVSVVIIIGLVLIFRDTNNASLQEEGNKEYQIKTGKEHIETLEIEKNENEFRVGDQVYFTVGNKDKAEKDMSLDIVVSNEEQEKLVEEKFEIDKGNVLFRPIYPLELNDLGIYKISVKEKDEVIYMKEIEVKE